MRISHFFLPHPKTHKKAHLISIPALLTYIALFIFLQFSLSFINKVNPGVLGINSSINQQELITLTNAERAKNGLPPLAENPSLSQAALEKAKNMFEENYWAHYSPSGKDPWGFISRSGYKFTHAGENLARNFYTSNEVVQAWMASTAGHKENILNSKYQEIGIAVMEGTLNGEPTILVVQEFGRPIEAIAQIPEANTRGTSLQNEPTLAPTATAQPNLTAGVVENKKLIDPYKLNKNIAFSFLGFIGFLLIIDLYVIRRRAIHRIASHHLPHLALISVAMGALMSSSPGSIL